MALFTKPHRLVYEKAYKFKVETLTVPVMSHNHLVRSINLITRLTEAPGVTHNFTLEVLENEVPEIWVATSIPENIMQQILDT